MDLDAIRKRLNQLQTTNTRTSNLWKPQPGKTQIRIVPNKYSKDIPFIELFFHYDLGGKTYLSPTSFGRPDPIEEFANKLKSSGNRDDWKLGKKLEAKMRTFAPMVVRGEEAQGVKFWGFGKLVYQELLGVMADPDYGDITDPINGRDIAVEFKTAEETGKNFPSTSVRVKPNQSPITDDVAILENLIENQKDIMDVYQELSYDDLAEALQTWLSGGDEKEEVGDAKSSIASTTPTTSDATAAFDDLFNK
jgi:hypothetical protein